MAIISVSNNINNKINSSSSSYSLTRQINRIKDYQIFSLLYTMNLQSCYCLGTTNNNNWPSYERIGYDSIVCVIKLETRMKIKRLRMLWRKIKRENIRNFCSSRLVNVQYDPSSYLKNFDDGISKDDDNVLHSFYARFGTSSVVFYRNELMGDSE
ncbi:unnamed protein product [Lupinus luteus]|uniref:Uncharacterized protein n=1 Tax=Lupinus luteus TaxID=3873 RepID=A0AAV1XWC7_LUPLU